MLHTYVLLIGACLPLAAASVYPTEPVQATIWTADTPMRVRWIEDGAYPTLSKMGRMTISLWRNTDTYLAELASQVDPMRKTCWVTVPGGVVKAGSTYTLRFSVTAPIDAVVYSADFAIRAHTTTTTTTTGTSTGGGALATPSANGTVSGVWTVPTTATGSASTTRMQTSTTDAASGSPRPSGTLPGDGGPVQRVASAGRRGVDVEKLKFRFVFVIWPVLMGITMAL